jgi:hypothetical protein
VQLTFKLSMSSWSALEVIFGVLLCKQGVAGSNPVTSTTLILALTIVYAAFSVAVFVLDFGTIGTTEAVFVVGSANP